MRSARHDHEGSKRARGHESADLHPGQAGGKAVLVAPRVDDDQIVSARDQGLGADHLRAGPVGAGQEPGIAVAHQRTAAWDVASNLPVHRRVVGTAEES